MASSSSSTSTRANVRTLLILVVGCLFVVSSFFIYPSEASVSNLFSSVKLMPGRNLPNCTKDYTCARVGDPCVSNFVTCTNQSSGLCCSQNLYCNNGTCVTDNLGEACENVQDCLSPSAGTLNLACEDSVCVEKYNTGDSCKKNSDCVSDMCDETDQICNGISTGDACPFLEYPLAQPCKIGSRCVLGTCLDAGEENSPCLGLGCGPGLVCAAGICKKLFSLPQQSTCNSGAGTMQCKSHSACVACGVLGQCLPGKSFSMNGCEKDGDCASNSCICSSFTGESYCELPVTSTNCQTETENLFNCMTDHDCPYDANATPMPNNSPLSCTRKHCHKQYVSARICECFSMSVRFGNCYYEEYCSKIGLWIIAVVVVAVIIICILCCVCAFVCHRMRKKRAYQAL